MLFQTFKANHRELFVVGGAVRDWLMGEEPKDFDLTTNALPEEMESWFVHTLDHGKHFGTIGVIINGQVFEITTYRSDTNYKDGRHPENVHFGISVQEDVKRRDFTINGLLMDENGVIFDFVGGQEDIANKIVRTIGNPKERFEEDRLRKWRCIRFATTKNMVIHHQTLQAIIDDPIFDGVSMERIREELNAILLSTKVGNGGRLLVETGMWQTLVQLGNSKGMTEIPLDQIVLAFQRMETLPQNLEMRLVILILTMEEGADKAFLNFLKYSTNCINRVLSQKKYFKADLNDEIEMKKTLANLGIDQFWVQIALRKCLDFGDQEGVLIKQWENRAEEIFHNQDPLTLKDLDINGHDVLTMGYNGKSIAIALETALEYVYIYPQRNKKQVLLDYLKEKNHG